MALDPIDYRSQPSRRRPSEGLDQLATLCLTEVLLPGKLASYQLPTPRDGVRLPTKIVTANSCHELAAIRPPYRPNGSAIASFFGHMGSV